MTVQSAASEIPTPKDSICKLVIAGWTGRDPRQVQKHIDELQAIGVKPPSTVPVFYEVSPLLMTTDAEICVVGPHTSGEVEFVLIQTAQGLLVTVGSDHTDRWLEAVSVHHSKQVCAKPVASNAWRLETVMPHWDQLILRSYSTREGYRRLYQEGPVTAMLAPEDLITRYRRSNGDFAIGTAMSCGTLVLYGEIEHGDTFELELEDPVRKHILRHLYRVNARDVAS
jgi:Protein of unknown function (DUF2848)